MTVTTKFISGSMYAQEQTCRGVKKNNNTDLIKDFIKFIFQKIYKEVCQDRIFEAATAILDRNKKISIGTRDIKRHVHLVPKLYEWLIHNATRIIIN
jgi:hypothetical protein